MQRRVEVNGGPFLCGFIHKSTIALNHFNVKTLNMTLTINDVEPPFSCYLFSICLNNKRRQISGARHLVFTLRENLGSSLSSITTSPPRGKIAAGPNLDIRALARSKRVETAGIYNKTHK